MFTTEPSMKAMLDPRIVAASVRRLRLGDSAAAKAGVAWMTPASQGGRVNPIMWALEDAWLRRRDLADCASPWQRVRPQFGPAMRRPRSISLPRPWPSPVLLP